MENLCTETDTFCMEATIRGYHVYRDIWEGAVGEVLLCKREPDNRKYPYAVATTRAGVTVGHVPKKISSVCSLFLLHGGAIRCRVIASKRYSGDLPQGGL